MQIEIEIYSSRIGFLGFAFQGSLLGVFQKLLASKLNDHEGFYLLQTLTEEIPE